MLELAIGTMLALAFELGRRWEKLKLHRLWERIQDATVEPSPPHRAYMKGARL